VRRAAIGCTSVRSHVRKSRMFCDAFGTDLRIECLSSEVLKKPLLVGDHLYSFKCRGCAGRAEGKELFKPLVKNWFQITKLVLFNLTLEAKRDGRDMLWFHFKDDIQACIKNNWDTLCEGKSMLKNWINAALSPLENHTEFFKRKRGEIGSYYFCMVDPDEVVVVGLPTGDTAQGAKIRLPAKQRKESLKSQVPKKPKRSDKPTLPGASSGQYSYVCISSSLLDCAPQLEVSSDRLTVTGRKGYRMARASHGVSEGAWYYEVVIEPHTGNTRLGWSTAKGDIQAPVGYDKYSYSIRDKDGNVFHQSIGKSFGEPYGPGDVMGFYIYLPAQDASSAATSSLSVGGPPSTRTNGKGPGDGKQPPTANDSSGSTSSNPTASTSGVSNVNAATADTLPGSRIVIFKNGRCLGTAFEGLAAGVYFPAVSLYSLRGGEAKVRLRFGPDFLFPVTSDFTPPRPISDLASPLNQEKLVVLAPAVSASASVDPVDEMDEG